MIDSELFTAHRSLLFDVAYRMTGSVADAEDLVQEAWLRWTGPRCRCARPPPGHGITSRLAVPVSTPTRGYEG
jgi:RNA polymerase sigma-70 factor, ECF subfamily